MRKSLYFRSILFEIFGQVLMYQLDVYKRQVLDGFIDMARAEIRMQKIEQALDEAEVTITADTRGFEADGHAGTLSLIHI